MISKIVDLKENILQFSCNVYVKFYYKIPWFYQDFKSENLFFKSVFNSRNENTGPDHVKSLDRKIVPRKTVPRKIAPPPRVRVGGNLPGWIFLVLLSSLK